MKTIVLVTFLVGLLACTVNVNGASFLINQGTINSTTSANDLITALKNFLTDFQEIMPCGFEPWNIPPLAPLTLDYVPFNFTTDYHRVTGNLSYMVVKGLNSYEGLKFIYNPSTDRFYFDTIVNEVQLLSEYQVSAWANLAGFSVQAQGDGVLNWKIKDFRMLGDFALEATTNGLAVENFNMQFWVGDVITDNWNNMWSTSLNNFVNRVEREFVLMLAEQIQADADNIYAAYLVPYYDNLMKGFTMESLTMAISTAASQLAGTTCSTN
ncbi:uncharacterized protein LOC119685425 [Teleopsis dalmanni]|uniref:uncharacterized protein LOC119685425 n=1 Tax=Teleopsis dalmanni TaxID=139649 RepID=UPI0018CED4D2|nr:uncharacterized protein LOC119685425 [Teleopsis dalmanni]